MHWRTLTALLYPIAKLLSNIQLLLHFPQWLISLCIYLHYKRHNNSVIENASAVTARPMGTDDSATLDCSAKCTCMYTTYTLLDELFYILWPVQVTFGKITNEINNPLKQTNKQTKNGQKKCNETNSSTQFEWIPDSLLGKPAMLLRGYLVIAWAKISVITTYKERNRKCMSL